MLIIIVIIILAISTLFHLLGSIVACFLMEIKIDTIQIFYGKAIYKYQNNSIKIVLGYLPFGGSISFVDQEYFSKMNVIKKIFVDLSGPMAILLSAAIIITISNSMVECVKGFEQIITGSFAPIELGTKRIKEFNNLIIRKDLLYYYAILCTKIAAFHLLPIPPLNGGRIILDLFPYLRSEKRKIIAFNFGFLITMCLIIIWLYIIFYQMFFSN